MAFSILLVMLMASACSNHSTTTQTENSNQNNNEDNQGEQSPQKGGELTVALGQILSNTDPLLGNSGHDHITLLNMYDTLVFWDSELQPQPGLATSWEYADEKTVILHLREGVTFHDGTPFDAEAVKVNLERANSETSRVSDLINVQSIEVVDTYTVKLYLSQPDSSIILALSDRAGMMVSPKILEKSSEEFEPIGTGPYKFVSWVPNGEVVMEAYDEYWDKDHPAHLDKLTVVGMPDENTRINAVSSGEVDIAFPISTNNVPTLEKNPNVKLDSSSQIQSWQIYVNTAKPPLDNVKVRQAIQYAIDRDALNKAILLGLGEAAHQHFPESYWAHNPDVRLNYDPEKSKQLLAEAGVENVKIEIVLQSAAFPQRLMEAVSQQLSQVGIQVDLIPMELTKGVTELFAEKRYNAGMWPWTGRPDPQMTLQNLWGDKGFYNAGSRNSDELEAIIAKSAATNDPKEREQVIREAVKIAIVDDVMNIPLVFEPATALMGLKVQGYEGNLAGKPKLRTIWLEQ